MRISILWTLTAASAIAALSGCGGESAPARNQTAGAAASADAQGPTRMRNRHQDTMMAATDENRRIGLVRAIRGTGNRCPRRVEPNPAYQGDYEGMALWTARCDNNRQYAVFIAPNGDVQVRNCEEMAQLRLPACRALPPAAPNQPARRSSLPPTKR